MFKPKTLLKVVAIILVITGVLGMIGTAVSYMLLPRMGEIPGVDMSLIEKVLTPFNLITSIISSIACIGAGIFGFSGKSAKWAKICAGVYTGLLIVSVIQSVIGGTFTFLVAVDFILPVLYWWGLYQSE